MIRRFVRIRLLTILLVVCFLCLFAGDGWACPTCKDGLSEGENSANLVRGYFWSIVFMMSMPFLILGGLGSYMYYEICKARRIHGNQPSPESSLSFSVPHNP